jgi:hypothetical protein
VSSLCFNGRASEKKRKLERRPEKAWAFRYVAGRVSKRREKGIDQCKGLESGDAIGKPA